MSNLKLGIVGLPNVGKSTLFNALTGARAPAENYPFCTVDPNVGVVEVPDPRLDLLYERVQPKAKVPTVVSFVDIAGLVKGAAQGEGLGNQFLAHIREVDAIVNVVRCFEDPDVAHVLGSMDPIRDRDIVNVELALADLQTVERRLERVEKTARSGDQEAQQEAVLLRKLQVLLSEGRPARHVRTEGEEEERLLVRLQLLTSKRELYVANIAESDLSSGENRCVRALREAVETAHEPAEVIPLAAGIEAELMQLAPEERLEFLRELGLEEPGLHRLVRAGHRLLGLISFFTHNEKEARAWTIQRGTRAQQAAGEIHTDFARGFIRAETLAWDDFVRAGSMKVAREHGLIRSEGRDYVVQDGDIILFRFNI
ncbi:MAG: redox-regulated ATPase YchF [Gemmatimonadetes bacterium]|nr:redox-regulated ATPase YchF [Gemmatimonadota bacterium]